MFYLRLEEELSKLGLHKVHSDGAFFVYVKEAKLHVFVPSHVDDLFMSGDDDFELNVQEVLKKAF